MARRSRDERRLDYLDAGIELLTEDGGSTTGPGLAFAHVRLVDVAERAGVTKGALYHLWENQEAFWHDLLLYLLAGGHLSGMSEVSEVTRQVAESTGTTGTPVAWANQVFDRFKDDTSFVARLGILSYLRDDDVRSDLADEFRTSLTTFESMVADAIASMGRRPLPGTRVRDVSVAVACLMHGLVLEHRIDPARTDDVVAGDGEHQRVSLFAALVGALMEDFTEPVGDDPSTPPPEEGRP